MRYTCEESHDYEEGLGTCSPHSWRTHGERASLARAGYGLLLSDQASRVEPPRPKNLGYARSSGPSLLTISDQKSKDQESRDVWLL